MHVAEVRVAHLGRGDFFGEISVLIGEPPSADVLAETLLRCLVVPGRAARVVPARAPAGDAAHAQGGGASRARGESVALADERRRSRQASTASSSSAAAPAACRRATRCGRLGIDHAVLSADDAPGRDVPPLPALREPDQLDARGRARGARGRARTRRATRTASSPTSPSCARSFPSTWPRDGGGPARQEMEAGLARVRRSRRHPGALRLPLGGNAPRRRRPRASCTSDGEYRCRAAVFAVGATEPWVPGDPGSRARRPLRLARRRARTATSGRRVVIIGKRNSAFEVGEGLLDAGRARADARLAAAGRHGAARALAASSLVPDAVRRARRAARPGASSSTRRSSASSDGTAASRCTRSTRTRPEPLVLEADVVIAATGFRRRSGPAATTGSPRSRTTGCPR